MNSNTPPNIPPDFDLAKILAMPIEEVVYTPRNIPKPIGAVGISKLTETERKLFHFMVVCGLSEMHFEQEALSRAVTYSEVLITSSTPSEVSHHGTLVSADEVTKVVLNKKANASSDIFWGAVQMRLASKIIIGYENLCLYGDNEIGLLKSSKEEQEEIDC